MNNNFRARKRKKPKGKRQMEKRKTAKEVKEEDKCLISGYAFYVCI